jgi:tetratricopeptide (TPR) repeat protein
MHQVAACQQSPNPAANAAGSRTGDVSRRVLTALMLFAVPSLALAGHPLAASGRKAVLLDGLGDVHHPVSTKNPEAQKFFDQGLRLIYAFNHDEARLAFERAAELDPALAMAQWGIALSVEPNYNLDAAEEQLSRAYMAIHAALKLSARAPEHEQAYIQALAHRYASDPKTADKKKLARAYKNAMAKLARRYPDDLDAATLYAESMMNLRPWELWSPDGTPAEDTREIIAVLESVLRRNPRHTGAHHYLIHAVEASQNPQRGLASAHVLADLAPAAGHLVHMPAHIFLRVGDYDAAAKSNVRAAKVDETYIKRFGVQGVYPMMYYSHNLHFLAVANAMQGHYEDAKDAADRLAAHVGPHLKEMPMLEFFMPTPTLVQVRFQKWDDILKLPAPEEKHTIVKAIRHFARGSALAVRGQTTEALGEQALLDDGLRAMPADLAFGDRNKAKPVLTIPKHVLAARIALAQRRPAEAVEQLLHAVAAEDLLNYIEPADWHIPTRELLGAVHFQQGDFAAAENVFRQDLRRNPRNGRSLLGLAESLRAQKQEYAAQLLTQEFQAAWRNADVKPRLEDY